MKTQFRSAVVILLLGGLASSFVFHRFQNPTHAQPPKRSLEYRVDNTIRERGTIESTRASELRCELEGVSTILAIVPEGSRVKKGDLLVELDDSALRDKLVVAQIQVEQAKAQLVRSQVELEAAKRDGEGMVRVSEKALQAAKLSMENVLDDNGELAYEMIATESELTIAKARLKMANNLITSAPGDRGSKSVPDLRMAIVEAQEMIKVAEARKKRLEREREFKAVLLDLEVAKSEMHLVRQKHDLEKVLLVAEAEIRAKEAAFDRDRRILDQAEQQLEKCKIYAPQAGIVLYATAAASRTGRGTMIGEGAQVRERQPIVRIPDLNSLHVKVHVSESRIARVRAGQAAQILIDAFPDRVLHGKVKHVSDSPEPASWFNADVKEYVVLVSIDKPADLKIGLTAMVEIDAGKTQKD